MMIGRLTPMKRLKQLDEADMTLRCLTGYGVEELVDLFKAGYTLASPTVEIDPLTLEIMKALKESLELNTDIPEGGLK